MGRDVISEGLIYRRADIAQVRIQCTDRLSEPVLKDLQASSWADIQRFNRESEGAVIISAGDGHSRNDLYMVGEDVTAQHLTSEMESIDQIKTRAATAGRAQDRVLGFIALLGLFYLFLDPPLMFPPNGQQLPVKVPLINLPIPRVVVWTTGSHVLFLLVLAFHGALARTQAAVSSLGRTGGEQVDLPANMLDYMIATVPDSNRGLKDLFGFAYPAFLTLFHVEAFWLLYALATTNVSIDDRWLLASVAGAIGVYSSWRTIDLWRACWRRFQADA